MKISMLTLGCKVNAYEAECIANELIRNGHEVTDTLEPADVYILSTCAVTNEAERKSRQMVAKLRKLNPNAKIIVCGCASQHNSQQFSSKDNVTITLGTSGKQWIPNLLNEIGDYTMEPTAEYEHFGEPKPTRTRAYVKVQDGCNNFCSYCLIPYLRGRSRSRDLESIVVEVFRLSKISKEIVLTGINISAWGQDINLDLVDLMSSVNNIPARIRISSMEMNIITPELLNTMQAMPNFCDHFHLSIQSACDRTLKDMNRHYTIDEYIKKVELIRKCFPHAGITTDLIIGYPTETDQDFATTLQNVQKIGFADMHLFPYSRREGTVASRLPMLDSSIVSARVEQMTALRDEMKLNFLKQERGMIYEVLFEQQKDGYYVGHTRNFIKVYAQSDKIADNTLAMVRIGAPYEDGVIGEVVQLIDEE
ncbi:MAG: tRNA (N(6)-L-threonylcarbamoyladenosine(37)-C(2))-methylthiotransferase MtaB [Clostridia bacterium]|nr:tRNA (N(6)-L-threonylcarbamoyladenosine(37)-C(2))-methylthiotransferase MtaB [Clostridia bacterium]